MADRQVVTRVWIETGCIVCDACQTACPEVFEVRDQTCIIRPEALAADVLERRTQAIQLAAEECPVNVIRYEVADANE
ncbi:MAG: ferredoxin [Planctomycetes bacterium]|nr:ferredoxin [Planctomycetota bacterium]